MKVAGRIILLAVAVAIFALNIPTIITTINTTDWTAVSDPAFAAAVATVASRGVACLGGLIALVCALIGRATFTLGLISLIMIAMVVIDIINNVNAGVNYADITIILRTIADFGIPIGYFVGTLFISFGRR